MEHKSERMMQTALAHGWKAQIKPTIPPSNLYEEIIWDLYCVRESETLHVQFIGNKQTESTYTFYDKLTHPAHRAAVVKILIGSPDIKNLSKENLKQALETRILPFTADSPFIEIMLAVLDREVKWVRRIDGELMSGVVERSTNLGKKYFRIYESKAGRRILEFQDREGFHAVALEQIVEVA
jgi:hypothetical protein